MRIPDEIQTQADNLYWDREHKHNGFGCAEEAYEFIANWARHEALSAAAAAVRGYVLPADPAVGADDEIRALELEESY